ncbi:MAG: hypothetical protein NXI27_13950 [Alphaproteobacteria bacterium]|nr:hypothetical protein [Alphaproteobacteria bacterium]
MRLLIGSLFAFFYSLSAFAGNIAGSEFKFGNWTGGAYTDSAGTFANCTVSAAYKGGDRLYFSVNRDSTITVAIQNPGFRLIKGETFPVTLKVDRRAPFRGQAYALDTDFAILTIENFDRALSAFRKGYVLRVDSGNREGVYGLEGTFRALELAGKCALTYFDHSQAPDPAAPRHAAATGIDKSLLYQIATGMIAEIGVRDFQFWSEEQTRNFTRDEAVFWNAPSVNLVGGVYVRPAGNIKELRETDAADLQQMATACKGDILTGARKVESAEHPTREVRGICTVGKVTHENIVSKVLLDGIIVYTLLLFTDEQKPTEKVEQDRRQMSEDVVSRAASFIVPSQ